MKKLLLGTAAIAMGLTVVAGSAQAQVKLDLGGHVKAYTSWLDQDTRPDNPATAANEGLEERNFDILRESELHFSGETTLDNGLTVGVHMETDIDGTGGDDFDTEEGYAYFSGAWGRVNFGLEDGATYLLQVAAPSADSNYDGIRQWVSPINYAILQNVASTTITDNVSLDDLFSGGLSAGAFVAAGANGLLVDVNGDDAATFGATGDIYFNSAAGVFGSANTVNSRLDYDQAVSGYSNKLTYMTPVFNGFQAGVSYTPEIAGSRDFGNNDDDTIGDYGDVFELAARYEGQFDEVGVAFGGGWTHAELEADNANPILYRSTNTGVVAGGDTTGYQAGDTAVASLDDREAWNVGVDFDWKAFGLGGAYMEDDNGISGDNFETETWVVGLDYTTGPFKLGGSYYDVTQNIASAEIEMERWTGGLVYTYGPGMTFRGSISWTDHDENVGTGSTSFDATSVLFGTQINF